MKNIKIYDYTIYIYIQKMSRFILVNSEKREDQNNPINTNYNFKI